MRSGKANKGKAKIRTGLGKTDRPGSQGGLWKRGDYGSRTEAHRETDGFATVPYHYARATFLSRLHHFFYQWALRERVTGQVEVD